MQLKIFCWFAHAGLLPMELFILTWRPAPDQFVPCGHEIPCRHDLGALVNCEACQQLRQEIAAQRKT